MLNAEQWGVILDALSFANSYMGYVQEHDPGMHEEASDPVMIANMDSAIMLVDMEYDKANQMKDH